MRLKGTIQWGACFVLALGIHASVAAVLLARWGEESAEAASAPVLMVDMSPVSAAPTNIPTDLPPDLVERQFQTGEETPAPETPEDVVEAHEPEAEKPVEVAKVEPEPEKPVETKPEPMTQSDLSILPPPRPPQKVEAEKPDEKKKDVKKKPPPRRQASLASATSAADRQAERVTAPQASAAANGSAMPDWRARVAAAIARAKRYPADAQSRGEQGVASVSFLIDGSGRVHNPRLSRSTGSSSLDNDAVAWIMRAQPLPPPPGEKSVHVTLPLSYTLR